RRDSFPSMFSGRCASMDTVMPAESGPSNAGYAAGAFAPQDRHSEQLAERGLCHYMTQVATGLGLGMVGAYWDMACTAPAYPPLEARLPGVPNCDVALTWDGTHGWTIGVEYGSEPGLLLLGYLGESVLPSPRTVVDFVERALTGEGQVQWSRPQLPTAD